MSTEATAVRPGRTAGVTHEARLPARETEARIGPNSVLRTLEALGDFVDAAAAEHAARAASLPPELPGSLIPEAWFVRLVREVRCQHPAERSERVLREAGIRTGAYVTANRIPAPFRLLLRFLPARLAIPLLLRAFRHHAWTFAGSGRFRVEGPFPGTIVLEGAPTCRDGDGPDPSGSYYEAAFETLLDLAAPGIRVREVACTAGGAPACRYRLQIPGNARPAGDPSCASS